MPRVSSDAVLRGQRSAVVCALWALLGLVACCSGTSGLSGDVSGPASGLADGVGSEALGDGSSSAAALDVWVDTYQLPPADWQPGGTHEPPDEDCVIDCFWRVRCGEDGALLVDMNAPVKCEYYPDGASIDEICLAATIPCGSTGCDDGMCNDDRAWFESALEGVGEVGEADLECGPGPWGLPDVLLRNEERGLLLHIEAEADDRVGDVEYLGDTSLARVYPIHGRAVTLVWAGEELVLEEATVSAATSWDIGFVYMACAGTLDGRTAGGETVRIAWAPAGGSGSGRCMWHDVPVRFGVQLETDAGGGEAKGR